MRTGIRCNTAQRTLAKLSLENVTTRKVNSFRPASFKKLVRHLQTAAGVHEIKVIDAHERKYCIIAHCREISPFIKPFHSSSELQVLRSLLEEITEIRLKPGGRVSAAERPAYLTFDPTHYDAIWLRDSLWAYLALKTRFCRPAQKTSRLRNDAAQILFGLLDYLSSPKQRTRFRSMIDRPAILKARSSPMDVVHIRFDANSPVFEDVLVNGKPQIWNHKQNDALGLFFDLILRALENGEITPADLSGDHWETLAYFPAYFSQTRFFEMEDAGIWEEIERVNTSSVALVTSSLERLLKLLTENRNQNFSSILNETARRLGIDNFLKPASISELIDQGYGRIFSQLETGGESPLYPKASPRYRTSDAALLNLLYPARLQRLTREHKDAVLTLIQPLIGRVGIRRYYRDSYQSGNFWFNQTIFDEAALDLETADTRSAAEFAQREKQFIWNSEAQWFFDSWYSKCCGLMFREYCEPHYREKQLEFFNRALGQITGGTKKKPQLGADGNPVPPFSLPESYNMIISANSQYFAPSPIVPLNWAKASLWIAFEELAN